MGKKVYTAKVCKDEDFLAWKSGQAVFLVKEQCFTSLSITQERLDYMKESFADEDINWDEMAKEGKQRLFIECLHEDGKIPVTYDDYCKAPHIEPVVVEDIVLFWTYDGSLDVNDDTYLVGSSTVNMSKIMRLFDPENKYTKEEMIDIYNDVYPHLKKFKDEEGENQE